MEIPEFLLNICSLIFSLIFFFLAALSFIGILIFIYELVDDLSKVMRTPGFPFTFNIYALLVAYLICFVVYGLYKQRAEESRPRWGERVMMTATVETNRHRYPNQMPSTTTSATNTHICSFCGGCGTTTRCSRCKVTRYCSGKCQLVHWRRGHDLECKKPKSPADVDFASAVSNEGLGTSHMDISISDPQRNQVQVPSTSAGSNICLFCNGLRTDVCPLCKNDMGVSSSNPLKDQHQMSSTSASPYICSGCGIESFDDGAEIHCSRCKVTRYCSEKCQIAHWRRGHDLECCEAIYPSHMDRSSSDPQRDLPSTSASSNICLFCNGRTRCFLCTDDMGVSSSNPLKDQHQISSTSACPYICSGCGIESFDDGAEIRCSRCKVTRYCSAFCQIEHWSAAHGLECEEYNSPTSLDTASVVSTKERGASPMGKSSFDQMPTSSASPHICFVCGDWAKARCSRCKVVRYCSHKCQLKHWREGHRSKCKKYIGEQVIGSDPVDIPISGLDRDQYQKPSAPASRDFCFVCGDWSDTHCSRCKVIRYCSQACETKHWSEGHKLECKEHKSPANVYFASVVSRRGGLGHVGTPSSEYQNSKKDGMLANTVHSPKRTSIKELPSVEECPICFSTIHTSEPSCPLLVCDICGNKFHSTCLLNWFSTSKRSRCPVCQSLFSNRKVQPC